ncbi:transcriptional regulator [Sinomonas cellulolyticus]|jgi:two-component system response regulator QseB|uniref:Response regulator transcription factor n=1 Tax=Sinomonas cellulolyticus TaxID=2801916 RepID=A0ABS1JYE2_9MICC|nr:MULTISPECIES: response regulator transcription factor [Sinomonas]MBL0704345.1 response regulator transcription factor [Sinomonas cellulolyticus]GHG48120.1 transcriptional regulator [Sinomonas sp. KCTC 49339]
MNARPRVLLVEDDRQLGPLVAELLGDEFDVTLAADGRNGLELALGRDWGALVVDRGLPELDGVALVKSVRAAGLRTPILLLTALGSVPDKVEGLDAGANDYLVKPFDSDELAARLRALTRAYGEPAGGRPALLAIGSWDLDPAARVLTSPYGHRVELSAAECALLARLAEDPTRVHSRAELLESVFDTGDTPGVVDTYVHYLRKKTDRTVIRTVHGVGYQLGGLE